MESHAAQEERHEQGKRRAKLEAGFAEVGSMAQCNVYMHESRCNFVLWCSTMVAVQGNLRVFEASTCTDSCDTVTYV